MESYGEVGALDFLQLMEDYLSGTRDARSYRQGFSRFYEAAGRFERRRIPDCAAILRRRRLRPCDPAPHTIEEPELRKRVADSANRLASITSVEQVSR